MSLFGFYSILARIKSLHFLSQNLRHTIALTKRSSAFSVLKDDIFQIMEHFSRGF